MWLAATKRVKTCVVLFEKQLKFNENILPASRINAALLFCELVVLKGKEISYCNKTFYSTCLYFIKGEQKNLYLNDDEDEVADW